MKFPIKNAETLLFVSLFMMALEGIVIRSLIYDKSCSSLYSDCSFLRSKNLTDNVTMTMRKLVQQKSSKFSSIYGVLSMVIPLFIGFYFGLIVDKGKYVQPWVFSMLANFFGLLMIIIIIKLNLKLEYLYLAGVIKSLFGGEIVFMTTSFSYIVKNASPGTESWRIILTETVIALGIILGNIFGGIASVKYGYMTCMFIIFGLCFFCLTYPLLFLSNIKVSGIQTDLTVNSHLRAMISLFSSANENRKLLLGYIILYLFSFYTNEGYYFVSYLYVSGDPFLMNNAEYSYVITIAGFGTVVTGLIGILLFKKNIISFKKLAFTVSIIGSAGYLLTGLANKNFLIYIGAIFYSISSLNIANSKSILVSLVNKEENGRLFALIFIARGISLLVAPPAIIMIYSLSLKIYSGIVFLNFSVISVLVGIIFLFSKNPLN